jgi:hypothetical protein
MIRGDHLCQSRWAVALSTEAFSLLDSLFILQWNACWTPHDARVLSLQTAGFSTPRNDSMPMMPSHALLALATLALAAAQVPSRPPTWRMNESTIIMPCNYTGFTDPQTTKNWAVIDFGGSTDWCDAPTQLSPHARFPPAHDAKRLEQ